MFDREMLYVATSARWRGNYGLDDVNLVGRSHYEVFPDIPERWKEAHRRALAGEILREEQDPFPRADGRLQWIRWEMRPWRHADGAIGGILIFSEDVSARVEMEQALRESRRDLDRAQAVARTGSWRFDLNRNTFTGSTEAHRIFRHPPGPLVNFKCFLAAVHPDDREHVGRSWRVALDGAPYDIEFRIVVAKEIKWLRGRAELEYDSAGNLSGAFGSVQDITDKKEIEDRLRESEARYRMLYENLRDAFVQVSMDGRIIEFNDQYHQMLGYSPEELRALTYQELTPERWHDYEEGFVQSQAIPRGYSDIYEKEYRRKDGTVFPVELRTILSRDASGRPNTMWAIVRDISLRKQAEEKLRESEERLRLAQQAGRVGVFDWNLVTNEAVWTPEMEDILGLPHGGFEGRYEGWSKHVHPEDLGRLEALFATWLQSSRDEEEWEYRFLRDAEVKWISAHGRVFRDASGKPVRMIGTNVDITERKEAEEALSRSELRYRHLVEQMGDGLFVADPSGRFLDVNPTGCAQFGMTREEVLSRGIADTVPPEEQARIDGEIARFSDGGIHSSEWRFVRKDGSAFVGEIRGRRLPNGNLQGVLRDITERKRAQEQIQLLMREVNHRSKNMLTLVQAVGRQTLATTPEDFIQRFEERIEALAANQDLLVKNQWKDIDLHDLVHSQLAHFKDLIGTRISIAGPAVRVHARGAQAIGMALHELATNAGKYGALSGEDGRVGIAWQTRRGAAEEERFVMSWREEGGPAVKAPERRGFGLQVIAYGAEQSLSGNVRLEFPITGLVWRVECPLAELQA